MTDVEIQGQRVEVRANGLRHSVLRYGEPSAPDLLVLPGITSPAATADFLAVLLTGLGYQVTVPDVRGKQAAEASALLQQMGLKVDTTTFIAGDRVYQQNPRPGQVVDIGTTVTLALSFG